MLLESTVPFNVLCSEVVEMHDCSLKTLLCACYRVQNCTKPLTIQRLGNLLNAIFPL